MKTGKQTEGGFVFLLIECLISGAVELVTANKHLNISSPQETQKNSCLCRGPRRRSNGRRGSPRSTCCTETCRIFSCTKANSASECYFKVSSTFISVWVRTQLRRTFVSEFTNQMRRLSNCQNRRSSQVALEEIYIFNASQHANGLQVAVFNYWEFCGLTNCPSHLLSWCCMLIQAFSLHV